MEPAKKFLFTFLAVAFSLCTIVGILNVYVNAFGYYGDKQLGIGVVFNAQIAKLHYIEDMPKKPDAFVIGSSNSMRMLPKTIDSLFGCNAYNYGVYQANVEDFYCISHAIVEDLKIKPKLMIVCVDDWNFAAGPRPPDQVFYGAQNRLAYKRRLSKYLADFSWMKLLWAQVKSSLSYEQLQYSLNNLSDAYKKKDFQRAMTPISNAFYEDGTRKHYADLEGREITKIAEEGKYKLTDYLKRENDSLLKINNVGVVLGGHEIFETFDQKSLDLFDTLMAMFNKIGTKVILNVMPVQPYYQQQLIKKTGYAARMEKLFTYLNGLQNKYKNIVLVQDNHVVTNFNGLPDGFFDDMHPTSANSNLMLYAISNKLK